MALGKLETAVILIVLALFAFYGIRDWNTRMVAENREKAAKEEAACAADLKCSAERAAINASAYCKRPVEKFSSYSVRWASIDTFRGYRWLDRGAGTLTYIGDAAEFQTPLGAFQPVTYECDFDPAGNKVLNVRVRPGRLSS
jgi:hypothetical protein